MAGSQNPEIAIDALITVLTADTPGLFDAIDTERDDGIVIRDIAKWYRAPLQDYDAYPAAVVLASATDYPSAWRSDNIRLHALQLQIYELCNETLGGLLPQEILAIRLERTMQGIDQAIGANTTLSVLGVSQTDHVLVMGIQYSDFVPLEGRGMLRGVKMDLQALYSL